MRRLLLGVSVTKLAAAVVTAVTVTVGFTVDADAMYLDEGKRPETIYLWPYEDGSGNLPDGRTFCVVGKRCDNR